MELTSGPWRVPAPGGMSADGSQGAPRFKGVLRLGTAQTGYRAMEVDLPLAPVEVVPVVAKGPPRSGASAFSDRGSAAGAADGAPWRLQRLACPWGWRCCSPSSGAPAQPDAVRVPGAGAQGLRLHPAGPEGARARGPARPGVRGRNHRGDDGAGLRGARGARGRPQRGLGLPVPGAALRRRRLRACWWPSPSTSSASSTWHGWHGAGWQGGQLARRGAQRGRGRARGGAGHARAPRR